MARQSGVGLAVAHARSGTISSYRQCIQRLRASHTARRRGNTQTRREKATRVRLSDALRRCPAALCGSLWSLSPPLNRLRARAARRTQEDVISRSADCAERASRDPSQCKRNGASGARAERRVRPPRRFRPRFLHCRTARQRGPADEKREAEARNGGDAARANVRAAGRSETEALVQRVTSARRCFSGARLRPRWCQRRARATPRSVRRAARRCEHSKAP